MIVGTLKIPINYRLSSDAHSHYSAISMPENQVVGKDPIAIGKQFSTAIDFLHIIW